MKWLKELFSNGSPVKKAAAVLGLITAIIAVFGSFEARMQAVARAGDRDVLLKLEKVEMVLSISDQQMLAGMQKFQQTTDLRWAMQRKEVAKGELRTINKELKRNPNDPELKDDKEYWLNEKKGAEAEIRRLLKPKVNVPGHTGVPGG